MTPSVVSNSSPLMEQLGQLQLLQKLFSSIFIPPAVLRETSPTVQMPEWIASHELEQPIGSQVLRSSLGQGESETISLAMEIGARWVILDDRPARRLAQGLGLPVIGTLGILVASKNRGFLSTVRPCLDTLMAKGFHVSPHLYAQVLTDVGEGED
jgi:uncharacterized protein